MLIYIKMNSKTFHLFKFTVEESGAFQCHEVFD